MIETQIDRFVLRAVDIEQDAEKLAEMWRASDDQWPGTVSDGVPITAVWARDWFLRQDAIESLVWDDGEAFAGFCNLWHYNEPLVTYVSILNVVPAYQKFGLGRRFLTHFVQRAYELGSLRLDLHTWPGNMKAVPLYKKCGFFWEPGTSVHMVNFMPAILRLPCAQQFFAHNNWYASMQRELNQVEDDERWEGMNVYTYQFAGIGEALTVRVDAAARRITAVETDRFSVAAIAGDQEPPRGLTTPFRWRIANHSDMPMQVTLVADGTPDMTIDYRASMQVAPGETIELTRAVEVSATAARANPERSAPVIRTLCVIDGEVLELATGMRPQPAVEFGLAPEYVTLTPGVTQRVQLWLRSRLPEPIAAQVSIAPAPGLAASWTQCTLDVAAEGYAGAEIELRAEQAGVYALPIGVRFGEGAAATNLPLAQHAVFALAPGSVLGAIVDGKQRIENDLVRLIGESEGAPLVIYERATGIQLGRYSGYAAPPIYPSDYWTAKFNLSIEAADGQVVAVADVAAKNHPGFVLRRRVAIGAGPLLRINWELDNLAGEARSFRIAHGVNVDLSHFQITLPLADGPVSGPGELFPAYLDDDQKLASWYAARWFALTHERISVGAIWGADMEQIEYGHSHLLTRMYACAPQSRTITDDFWLYLGDGGWRAVARSWQQIAGVVADATATQEVGEPVAVQLTPVVAIGGVAESMLTVEHRRARSLQGTVDLMLPEGWQSSTAHRDIADVTWKQPHSMPLRFTTVQPAGAYEGRLVLQTNEIDRDIPLPLLVLGDGGAVTVREEQRAGQRLLTVDNGAISFSAAPGFGGTICSLRADGIEQLASSFPQAGAFAWYSPWYGGIMPVVKLEGDRTPLGRMWREQFTAEEVRHRDARGIAWHGVRLCAALAEEAGRGLTFELDAQTIGGGRVVRLALRMRNDTGAVRPIRSLSALIFVQPGGSRTASTFYTPEQQVRSNDRLDWLGGAYHWAAIENHENGRAIALASADARAGLSGWGSDGQHLQLYSPRLIYVPAYGAYEEVAFLAVARDLAEARRYAALVDL
jgi:GNAT superfamily N-acetyltransferase